jgi:heme-degrading monooxygenase HmoA
MRTIVLAVAASTLLAVSAVRGAPAGPSAPTAATAAAPAGARIARVWHGRTKAARAEEYAAYLAAALPKFRTIPGNLGYTMLREDGPDESHFMVVSWWTSTDAIRGYAGEDIAKTRFLPRDHEFLVDPESTVHNYRIAAADPAP